MGDEATRTRRGAITVVARTALGLLLLAQLAVLWIVAHPNPTRLPLVMVDGLAELAAGRIDFECREATIDHRGRVRLGGVRLSDSLNPGDAFTGDIDVLPDWRGLLLGKPRLIAAQARGQVAMGAAGAGGLVEDLVARVGSGEHGAELQAGARVGAMVLRADLVAAPSQGSAADAPADATAAGWNREGVILVLRALRSMEGAAGLSSVGGRVTLEGGFAENPAAVSPLPIQATRGRLRSSWDGKLRAELALAGLRGPGFTANRSWVAIDPALRFQVLAEGIRFDGINDARAVARGTWQPGTLTRLALRAETADSRASAQLELEPGVIQVRDLAARLGAQDLTGLAPVAQAARAVGIDLCGTVEILGGEARWEQGELSEAQAAFALSEIGWRDIRPALVRPERLRPGFQGDLAIDLRRNRLRLTRLDLAGIRGEIEGGLRAGDTFAVRLASSEGQPVNPSCLNALLGHWWTELWARFDLSASGTRPHADVRVEGRWGEPESIRTAVRARLERFGFMNARFLETDLWVLAEKSLATVRVDTLRGELDGQDAGSAHGTIRWDWQRPEWKGQPQIDFEGDLHPACALRLYDPSAAARLKGWSFEQPRIQVALGADRPLSARLESAGESTLGGVKVRRLSLTASQPSTQTGDLVVEATGEVSGGKAAVAITGDLASHNHVQVSVREWNRSGAEALLAQLGGPATPTPNSDPSQLTFLYEGTCDFSAPWTTQGQGQVTLFDPSLKTIHLLGLLSEGFDVLGIGFSSYHLNRAEVDFHCADGRAEMKPLKIEGEDALLKLNGFIGLQNGSLDLSGQIYLKDSPWGLLKYINPNRLIARMISVNVHGSVNKPEVQAKIGGQDKIK